MAEKPKQMDANSAATSTLLLGHGVDWWDAAMLYSLGIAAIAALAVLAFTAGSNVVNKRDAKASAAALELYKLETAGKVAEATTAGIAAGKAAGAAEAKAGKAETGAASAQATAALANERAASFEKDAAEARLETERLKEQFAWRELKPPVNEYLLTALSLIRGSVNIQYTDSNPESLSFASQFARIFRAAGWQVGFGSVNFQNSMLLGIFIPPNPSPDTEKLKHAFGAAGIDFSTNPTPPEQLSFWTGKIAGAPVLVIGAKNPNPPP